MQTIEYVHWQDEDSWLGYFEEFPDYWTQGDSLDDRLAHLKDLCADVTSGQTECGCANTPAPAPSPTSSRWPAGRRFRG